MTYPNITAEYVESQGGIFYGWFPWPIPHEMQTEFWAFRAREPQVRHDHFVSKDRVVVYSLPFKGAWRRNEGEPEKPVVSGAYESGVTSKPKYTNKQLKKRKTQKKEAAQ